MSKKIPKVKFIHFATLYATLQKSSYIEPGRRELVIITEEEKLLIAIECVNFLIPDKEPVFLGFIFRDSTAGIQRLDFETVVRPVLEKAGATFELVHESPYFCNRGYFYGNTLQFALFKVTKHEL